MNCGWRIGAMAALCVRAACAAWTLDLQNGSFERENAVVSCAVTREWVRLFETHTLAETTGGTCQPVACALDASGEAPVLAWLAEGVTAPRAVRTFAAVPLPPKSLSATDLSVSESEAGIAIRNGFYRLTQPVRGSGGFPRDITFAHSGQSDPKLYFLDRIVRPQGDGGRLASYCAKDCEDASTRVVFKSPLRVTVETRTGFGRTTDGTPGCPRAVYRYTYTAYSPVIDVSARYSREDDGPWRELHFLHLTRADRHYTSFVTGDAAQTHAMQPKGARSKGVSAPQWAVMSDGTNACGTGFDGAICWDASDEFVYYVRSGHTQWEGRTCGFDGGLYFGPARDGAWTSAWMGRERQPEILFRKDGKPWVPVEPETLKGAIELKNQALRVSFDAAEKGFDCLGIENRLAGNTRFVRAREGAAGLWSLTFRTPPDATGAQQTVRFDNRGAGARKVRAERVRNGIDFIWEGMGLPGEPEAVDVRAEVRVEPGRGASAWRLRVTNRSKRFGLWQSEYPLLRSVAPPRLADVLLPRGNWGGSLMKRHAGSYSGRYPSHGCPLQMLAFNLGDAGLYFAAHDGSARAKEVTVSREQDVTFRVLAENAGVPGAAGGPDFPVVIAAYEGDWWQAARRYRDWALRQAWASKGPIRTRVDYPQRLEDLGFWMLLSGNPEGVTNSMAAAGRLFPGVPVGVHWYCWHQIPFDHSYPEYFPTKDGMADAARALEGRGQTVMPYINARLWDRDIPSFAGAYAAACKQPAGTNYVETYGSGRSLVPMCPATALWQKKVGEVCGRLMEACGVGGIYLDQIGSAAPVACYDAGHAHPVGGGSHWVAGYHAMLRSVKAEAGRRGVALTTEDSAEPYMDVIDGCLAWNARNQEDVPLLPAVYSGYTIYFTSPQAAHDTLDAFCAAQARDFLWGCQLGWNDPWILHENHREKQRFQYELCRYRLAAKDFLVYGQLLDDVRPEGAVPERVHVWSRRVPHEARLPVVLGTVWRDDRGRLAVFVVNTGDSPQRYDLNVDPSVWLGGKGPWRLSQLTPDGEKQIRMETGCRALLGDLQPREIRALIVSRSK